MRIVQILPSLDIGGMERLAIDLALQQKAEGHQAAFYCTSHPGQLASQALDAGIPVHAFGKQDGFSPRLILALARRLRADRADVLHAHNALVLHYAVAAARLAGVPVVINTRHGPNFRWDPHCEAIWRRTIHWADAVVFVSEGVRKHCTSYNRLSQKNTHVIYNGLNLESFLSHRAQPGAHRPKIRFGAVGRLVPWKAHTVLVRAFGQIADTLPEAELHILGDGPSRLEIAQTIESLGLSKCVTLHGASRDVAGFLSTLDIFVQSSIDEGLPISLMEAMAAGLPVISTRLPGLAELAPEHIVAAYCAPGEAHALADAMLQVACSRDLPSLGERARNWATRFGIEETWRKYEMLFEDVLRRKSRSPLRHFVYHRSSSLFERGL
jgi:glycosyltransferase involved in cell wall biosynthesis